MKAVIAFFAFFAIVCAIGFPIGAAAGDAGARNAVAQVRSDARRLLARRVRQSGIDPKNVAISDVVVAGDQALLSWDSGKERGVMGLVVQDARWWDALDVNASQTRNDCWRTVAAYPLSGFEDLHPQLVALADAHNALFHQRRTACVVSAYPGLRRVLSAGGTIHAADRRETGGYDLAIAYARNDAQPGTLFNRVYVRAPTGAEFLPNPVPPKNWGGPTDVAYFDIDLGGTKRVTFAAGTTIDVWVPFVLDDTLRYDLSFVSGDKAYGPYRATLFDNVLHFELPAFVLVPDDQLEAEISGWY